MTTEKVQQLEEIQQFVRLQPRVIVRAGGTKPPLHQGANLDLSPWTGVVEYEPTEYTFTARSGTPLSEIRDMLAEHGQFLPFDPILVDCGATLGGTVAGGCSGPGRFRYGGVRDFLLGVQLVNGEGEIVRGGGKVVKNAAGFDIPKLMVGGLGRFGVMAELTFKVFPQHESSRTVEVIASDAPEAIENLLRVSLSSAEVACLDFLPPNRLLIRISGWQEAAEQHTARIQQLVQGETIVHEASEDEAIWRDTRELSWIPSGHGVVRVPLVPSQIIECEQRLAGLSAGPRRYSVGGNLLWLGWPQENDWSRLDELLESLQRPGLVIRGECHRPLRALPEASLFARRLLTVFDPEGKFADGKFAEEEVEKRN